MKHHGLWDRAWDPVAVGARMAAPLRWRRAGRVLVTGSGGGDLFAPHISDKRLDEAFATMLALEVLDRVPEPIFLLRTAHAARMAAYLGADPARLVERWARAADGVIIMDNPDVWFSEYVWGQVSYPWNAEGRLREGHGPDPKPWGYVENVFPLRRLWVGALVRSKVEADAQIPHLLATPAAGRILWMDPLLEHVDLEPWLTGPRAVSALRRGALRRGARGEGFVASQGIDLVVVGGSKGPAADPADLFWLRRAVSQARELAGGAFVTQLGGYVTGAGFSAPGLRWPGGVRLEDVGGTFRARLTNRDGADPAEWPEDLRGLRAVPPALLTRVELAALGDGITSAAARAAAS